MNKDLKNENIYISKINPHKNDKDKDKRITNLEFFEKEILLIIIKIKKISLETFSLLDLENENDKNINLSSNSFNTTGDMSLKLSQVEYEKIEEIDQDHLKANLIFFGISFFIVILLICLFYYRVTLYDEEESN